MIAIQPITEYNGLERRDNMGFVSVSETAKKWGITERVVRQYCEEGRVPGAFITGKTWNIPDDAQKPARKSRQRKFPEDLLHRLLLEKNSGIPGGIYHKVQIDLTYNSNHMEGSRLTHDQTRYIFETNTIDAPDGVLNVDDIMETVNHFRCIDIIIDQAAKPLSERLVKELHWTLKINTKDSQQKYFAVGDYKKFANEVGGLATTAPLNVKTEMRALIHEYEKITEPALDDLLEFHYRFERIHPFQDGNGRVGRLILFKECLRHNIVPFIITDDIKLFYYRGLQEWEKQKGYLRDTCLMSQDQFKEVLDYFGIKYKE